MENETHATNERGNSSNITQPAAPETGGHPSVPVTHAITARSALPPSEDVTAQETTRLLPKQAAEVSDCAVPLPKQSKPTKEQKHRAKKWANDNRRSFRSDDQVDSMIARECDATNCSESEAIKTLIRRGAGEEVVRICPHSSPEDIRRLIAAAHELARAIRSVRRRIDAPLTSGEEDPELMKLLIEWRRVAKELPQKLDEFLPNLRKLIITVTSLTPRVVVNARKIEPYLRLAESDLRKKSSTETNPDPGLLADAYRSVIAMLTSMGIFTSQSPCPPQK